MATCLHSHGNGFCISYMIKLIIVATKWQVWIKTETGNYETHGMYNEKIDKIDKNKSYL